MPDALDLLEFRKLLRIISGFTHGTPSAAAVMEMSPMKDLSDISLRRDRIAELMKMIHEGSPLSITQFEDVSGVLQKSRPSGAVLDAHELAGFIGILSISKSLIDRMSLREDLPAIRSLTENLAGFPQILKALSRSVDSAGNILDTASALLGDLREQARRLETKITSKLEEVVRDERVSVFLQDNFITRRSGRWVIPVRMDSKGQVSGVVHDVSKSGETAFMEPLSIIGLSNELETLGAEIKAEEFRILRNLTAMIRESSDEIGTEFRTIVLLDALGTVAVFSDRMKMNIPGINDSGVLRLYGARHPLLEISYSESGGNRRVVPLDVSLDREERVMVITGSNAGGKTIAIKTVGLLSAMAMSGLPVSASSSSSFPFTGEILADIGDEQSIESSLSTFAAHISNISRIMKISDERSLILIDELGTGTDPDEGSALACAILKELGDTGAMVFATTHLSQIKGFVHRTGGMLNASMDFDPVTLTPSYKLRLGEPGQSHAIDTASRYGLPHKVVDSAREMMGGMKNEFDNMMADLALKRARHEAAEKELREKLAELEAESAMLRQAVSEAEERKREVVKKAYEEASEIVLEAKREMNLLLERMKQADRDERRKIAKEAEAIKSELAKKLGEFTLGEPMSIKDVAKGDTVYVKSLKRNATVLEVHERQGRIRVAAGGMEIEVPAAELHPAAGKASEEKRGVSLSGFQQNSAASRINVVGKRVEEALSMIEPFLNHAALEGFSEVVIIHGLGKGILSRAVGEHLTGHPLVKSFRKGEKEEGGAGVTMVKL